MTKTEHYQLNQWAKSDRVLMEDFNRDNAKIDAALTNVIPHGVILLWSGAANALPGGWVLCDGANGTPDLRGRFVVGAGGEDYAPGDTGGAADEALVRHYRVGGSVSGYFRAYDADLESHDNRPPYYALCYIMKR